VRGRAPPPNSAPKISGCWLPYRRTIGAWLTALMPGAAWAWTDPSCAPLARAILATIPAWASSCSASSLGSEAVRMRISSAKVASGMYFSGETAISEVGVGGLVLDLHHRVLAIVQADELDFLGRQVVKRNLRRVTRELNVAGNPQEVRLTRVNGIRVRVTPLSHEGKNLAGLNQLIDIVVLIIERQRPGKLWNTSTDRPLLE